MTNLDVAQAMRRHHAAMSTELNRCTETLWTAGEHWRAAREAVLSYLNSDILPHAKAEEATIYPVSLHLVPLHALIRSMEYEHEVLQDLVQRLADAASAAQAQALATQAAHLFFVHAEKENRYILEALQTRTDIDLEKVLGDMQQRLAGEAE